MLHFLHVLLTLQSLLQKLYWKSCQVLVSDWNCPSTALEQVSTSHPGPSFRLVFQAESHLTILQDMMINPNAKVLFSVIVTRDIYVGYSAPQFWLWWSDTQRQAVCESDDFKCFPVLGTPNCQGCRVSYVRLDMPKLRCWGKFHVPLGYDST